MFVAQAALVIANARRYREERLGVVVFDAVTGLPKSFHREARRLVDSLRTPEQTPEQPLAVLTVRREDGREISLQEFPLAHRLD